MNNIIDIDRYQPRETDKFFFDTNVWMYFYCPLGGYKQKVIRRYDRFLKKILQAKATIYISSLVLSEFVNAYIRLEFNIQKRKVPSIFKDFKRDFRNTEAYKKVANDVRTSVQHQIMKLSARLTDNFSEIDLEDIFRDIESSDFNDNYYLKMAEDNDLIIITNDADFVSAEKVNVQILTANYKLLCSK